MSDKPLLKVSRASHNVSLQKPQFASAKLCVLVFGCFLACSTLLLTLKKWLFDFIVLKHLICVDLSQHFIQN